MDTGLNNHLKSLAEKYERKEFLIGDPSWFMHQVEGNDNKELLSFIAATVSYGSRKQFMPKIQYVLDCSKGNVKEWLLNGQYNADIPATSQCFYRLYTCETMNSFLSALKEMIEKYGTIRQFLIEQLQITPSDTPTTECIYAIRSIVEWFQTHGSTGVIPKSTDSSCKRVCMFMRWMVRKNSPVDIGLWCDIIDAKSLIIPMDTHVVQEANRLGLLETKSTSMSTAIKLTNKLKEIFPDDPLKGDFALFGIGVDKDIHEEKL